MWHWGDILGGNADVKQHSLLFVESVTWHFGLKVERRMNFVKLSHWTSLLDPYSEHFISIMRLWEFVGGVSPTTMLLRFDWTIVAWTYVWVLCRWLVGLRSLTKYFEETLTYSILAPIWPFEGYLTPKRHERPQTEHMVDAPLMDTFLFAPTLL